MKILFNLYATKSDIQELMGGGRWNKVSKVFDECKKLENDPMNLRPNKVPSQLVFKKIHRNPFQGLHLDPLRDPGFILLQELQKQSDHPGQIDLSICL